MITNNSLLNDNEQPGYRLQVAAFYLFTSLAESKLSTLLVDLPILSASHQIRGTILLAEEGLNGTICGPPYGIQQVLKRLHSSLDGLSLEVKTSWTSKQIFRRFKARRKKEIVTMGVHGINPLEAVGIYVDPSNWNDLVDDPNTLVIDTRNDYEVCIGRFDGAINPKTETFRSFPSWVENQLKPMVQNGSSKRIAMYCTGGIRCEKASSLLLQSGLKEIYHLSGGILRYLEEVPESKSRWQGECFVFDQRVALNHQLDKGTHELCHACGRPLSQDDLVKPSYVKGIQCDYCIHQFTDHDRARFAERQRQIDKLKSQSNFGTH